MSRPILLDAFHRPRWEAASVFRLRELHSNGRIGGDQPFRDRECYQAAQRLDHVALGVGAKPAYQPRHMLRQQLADSLFPVLDAEPLEDGAAKGLRARLETREQSGAQIPATASSTVPGLVRRIPMVTGSALFMAAAYASMNSVDQGNPGSGTAFWPGRLR